MNWRQTLREYCTFSKKDRIGILVLLGLTGSCYLLPFLFPDFSVVEPLADQQQLRHLADSLEQKQAAGAETGATARRYPTNRPAPAYTEGSLFPFDPNTLDAEGWKRLGLQDRVVRTLEKYRARGGRFRRPEDLQRIWGLPQGFYERVAGYIRISSLEDRKDAPVSSGGAFHRVKPQLVGINSADSAALIALPGIGPKLAGRILNFREKLGGFYSVEQVGETYGLPDSTFQQIRPYLQADASIRQLSVNTATKDELRAHPYIRWHLANALVEYRNQHGPFHSIEDLKKIVLMDEATYRKISPYLKL